MITEQNSKKGQNQLFIFFNIKLLMQREDVREKKINENNIKRKEKNLALFKEGQMEEEQTWSIIELYH